MPDVATDVVGNADKTRQLVRRERKVELAREGLHLFDMRRWNTGDIENDSPTYGYPDVTRNNGAIVYDASGNPVGGGYDNATADMVPSFKKSARHDLNDIADYSAYASKLRVRDRSRFWDNKFYLWPIPQSERNLNPNLTQNGY
ncbi:SusD family protein [compost metagenome]